MCISNYILKLKYIFRDDKLPAVSLDICFNSALQKVPRSDLAYIHAKSLEISIWQAFNSTYTIDQTLFSWIVE